MLKYQVLESLASDTYLSVHIRPSSPFSSAPTFPSTTMSTSQRFHEDIVIADYYRSEGHSTVTYDWGSYDGYFMSSKAHGFGVQHLRRKLIPGGLPSEERAVYRGDFKDGKREGFGRLEIPWDNKVYEGGWIDGKASGLGKMLTMKNGWAAEWEESGYRDGYRHGWGVTSVSSEHSSGTVWYTGGFKEGDRHGYYIRASGGMETYTSVRHGVTHGYQTAKKDGVVKTREFFLEGRKANPPTSSVQTSCLPSIVYFNPLGARYHDRSHTFNGVVNCANGDTYGGNLNYGVPHGYGIVQLSIAHRVPGTYDGGFKHGYACGYGVWMGTDGFVYAGGWLNGKPYGFGKITTGTMTYESFWEEGGGWKFESTWNLSPNISIFRSPSPAPIPPAWAL